jgi:hypothetical protein
VTSRIVGATLRDLSYVASRLRPDDKAEVDAQFDDWSPALIAALSLRDHAYVVLVDENPEAAFGAGRTQHRALWTAWSFMSRRGWRAVPRITEFVRAVMIPDIYASGGQRVEARALADNHSARRWLKRMGATEQGLLRNYGRNGEDFVLFEWCRCDFGDADVLPEGPTATPAAADAAA